METLSLLLALGALAVALVALALWLRAERRPVDVAPGGPRVAELERRLAASSRRLALVESQLDARGAHGAAGPPVDAVPRGTSVISRIGLVRFDAFDDTGGAQSFALALVDDDGDGIVLTSLHSRPTTRVYVKTIRRGVADAPLSAEEEQALRSAGITPAGV